MVGCIHGVIAIAIGDLSYRRLMALHHLLCVCFSTMKKLFLPVVAAIVALSFRAQGNIGKRNILNSLSNGYFSLNLRLPLCLIVRVVHWESTSQANSKMGQRQLRGDCNIIYPKGDYFQSPLTVFCNSKQNVCYVQALLRAFKFLHCSLLSLAFTCSFHSTIP